MHLAQRVEDARALNSALLANYSRNVKPKLNQTEPLQVFLEFQLLGIIEFDEVLEKLSVIAVTFLYWRDELMTWNPEDYGGLDVFYIESQKVWTPNLVLVNTVKDIKKIGFDDDWLIVKYLHNGSARYLPGGILSAKCDVDMTFFPWDKHVCPLQFSTWDYEYMKITPISDQLFLEFYKPSGTWNLVSTDFEPIVEFQLFYVNLTFSRKPLFMVVNVILPIVLMALISTVVFYIPIDSGERISYSITMLLAIGVFLTLVGDNLPKTSNPMPLFSYYLLSMLLLNACIAITNILSVKCFYIGNKQRVGNHWARFSRWVVCKERNNQPERYVPSGINYATKNSIINETTRDQTKGSALTKLNLTNTTPHVHVDCHIEMNGTVTKPGIVQNNTDTVDDFTTDQDGVTWHDVSVAIDKFSLIVSIMLILILTIVFFLIICIGGTK
ncbi:Neuronal acetylcholine receptor subunit alpha-7 [Mactra antiquata]